MDRVIYDEPKMELLEMKEDDVIRTSDGGDEHVFP